MKQISLYSLILTFFVGISGLKATTPVDPTITPEEEEGLMLMKEEEKLAHDVYAVFYEKWNLPVFRNIAASEQRHMNAIDMLLEEYGIDDPAEEKEGVFSNEEIQELYNNLVEKGSTSMTEALQVGATIEDLDINDLDKLLEETENEWIRTVYENLNRGSRNHLRTFYDFLKAENSEYTPIYLSQTRFDDIIAGSMERGGLKSPVNQAFCQNNKPGWRSNSQGTPGGNWNNRCGGNKRNAGFSGNNGCKGNRNKSGCNRGNKRRRL